MKQLFSFIFSKQFLKHGVLILVAFIIFVLLLFKWFNLYTQHGEYITLNDLTELTFDQTKELLDSKGLKCFIVDSTSDGAYNADFLPTAVLRQDPLPNSKVKNGRTIYLWLNPSKPMKAIPCLMGNTDLTTADEWLADQKLKKGEIFYVPMEGVLGAGNPILKMMIDSVEVECGDKALYGTKIDLVVGEKPGNNKVEIPNLLGWNLKDVEFILGGNLNLGTPIYDSVGLIDPETAVIYKQLPDVGGEAIRVGSVIDVWLIQDLPEEVSDRIEQINQAKSDTVVDEMNEEGF